MATCRNPLRLRKRRSLEFELTARLLDENHPIITLHGGGGMGKTFLALCVCHQLTNKTLHLSTT